MTAPRTAFAIRLLHWTVGLVVLLESCRTFLGAHAGLHSAGHAGTLVSLRLALSGAEIIAALLFLSASHDAGRRIRAAVVSAPGAARTVR